MELFHLQPKFFVTEQELCRHIMNVIKTKKVLTL
jgi:hypothetical protein